MKKNKLITIGWVGNKSCYLNINREEAAKRYIKNNPQDQDALEQPGFIVEVEFDDELLIYDTPEAIP